MNYSLANNATFCELYIFNKYAKQYKELLRVISYIYALDKLFAKALVTFNI